MTVYLKGVPRGRGSGFPVHGGLTRQGIYLVVYSQRHWGDGLFEFSKLKAVRLHQDVKFRDWFKGCSGSWCCYLKTKTEDGFSITLHKAKATAWRQGEEASQSFESYFGGSIFVAPSLVIVLGAPCWKCLDSLAVCPDCTWCGVLKSLL